MQIRCITIDDEPLALEKLHAFLARIPDVQVVASFSNCLEALPAIGAENPDLLFLDIEMEHITGIQLLEQVPLKPWVVIVSAYEKYALKGYELNVADYILKPYTFDRLLKTVEKIRSRMETEREPRAQIPSDFLFVKTDGRYVKIPWDEILYVEGMRDYLCLHTKAGKTLATLTFSRLLEIVPAPSFVRVHKSFVVNLKHVDLVEKHMIWLGKVSIPIGQSFREAFYRLLEP